MAYTRWGAIGEQAGRGLQSGLDMALRNKMKQKQITDFANKYGFDEEKIAGAMMGLPAVGGVPSLQDQMLYAVLKNNPQFAGIQMPTKATDPYAYYRKQPTQTQNEFPPIPDGVPSNNGVDAVIAADGKVGAKPYTPPPAKNFGTWKAANGKYYEATTQQEADELKADGAVLAQ